MSPTFVILCSVIGLTSGAGVLPDSVNAALGGTVTFTTSLPPTNTPLPSILWIFGTLVIVSPGYTNELYKDRITLSNFTGSLELRNLALSDAGDYSVTVQQTGARPEIGHTTLNVYEPVSNVRVTATNTDLVEFNDTVTLSCSASGHSLSFLWFNGSALVTPSDRVQFTNGGTSVTIVTVLRYDNESYSCKVSNPVSSSTSDQIPLSVSYGPDSIILETSGQHYEAGSNVSLSCLTESRPAAQFRWFLNGTLLPFTSHVIHLPDIRMDQSGNYNCDAFNSKTLRYATSQPEPISVWLKITNLSLNPTSEQPMEGTAVNLTCDASGSIVTREWMFNGIELQPSENIKFFDENRVLSFQILTIMNHGTYTCRISNPVSNQSIDYTMNVNSPNHSLSTGAIVGITIAVIVVVAGAAAGGFYVHKQKGTKQNDKSLGLEHVYENTSKTSSFKTDEENKHVYENADEIYDRKM